MIIILIIQIYVFSKRLRFWEMSRKDEFTKNNRLVTIVIFLRIFIFFNYCMYMLYQFSLSNYVCYNDYLNYKGIDCSICQCNDFICIDELF